MAKPIYIIVACGENRVIGKDGHLPWDIPEDARYYEEMTRGGIVICGRRVYEELGKAMPERKTLVLTRDPDRSYPDAGTAPSLPAALEQAQQASHPGPIWIAGGQKVYEEALELADKLYLTLIQEDFEGDTWFPEWNPPFSKTLSERLSSDSNYHYTFYDLARGPGE